MQHLKHKQVAYRLERRFGLVLLSIVSLVSIVLQSTQQLSWSYIAAIYYGALLFAGASALACMLHFKYSGALFLSHIMRNFVTSGLTKFMLVVLGLGLAPQLFAADAVLYVFVAFMLTVVLRLLFFAKFSSIT